MAEDLCSFNKDTFIIKLPKASPLILRMTILVIATVCGVYICSVCLKQISRQTNSSIEVIGMPCCDVRSENLKDRYLHYPQPESFNRAECAGNPVRFFVIISMQRSGSGWFETLLNSHINVSSNGEIFSVKDRRDNISSIIKTLDRVYNLDWLSSASKNECSAAVGLKWMLNQGLLDYPKEIAEYFNRRGVSAIFLFRRNLLRRMVSVLANSFDRYAKLLNGTHKSHVHSTEEAETLSKYKPFINSTSLISDLKEAELKMTQALAYFNNTRHILVYYEDLIKNRTKLVDIQDFLGIPQMPLTSRQVKIHRGPLWEHIKNWNDVNKTLKGTAYERFLHADY
uniref:Sulfotransferase n=1 Tax=Opuntia streptacantha TaxID=393608 RepID=A0A7C9A166_OPUST